MIHGAICVRPVDVLRLVLVLAEVAGGVEELLRDDRRAQRRVGERRALGRVVRAAALEVLAHRRDVEAHDLVAVDAPDLAVVVGDQLHRADPLRDAAHRASRRLDEAVDVEVLAELDVHQPGRRAVVERRDAVARERGRVAEPARHVAARHLAVDLLVRLVDGLHELVAPRRSRRPAR